MSQLRQPGDYLKYNRVGSLVPRIYTFTAETNQKEKKKKKKRQLNIDSRRKRTKTQREQDAVQQNTVVH